MVQCYPHYYHYRNKSFWEGLFTYFPLIRHGLHRKRRLQQFFNCGLCIRCLSNVFTEQLPSKYRETHTDTKLWEGFPKYIIEMDLGTMTCVPSFVKSVKAFES
jgi:hypothetical protein